MVSQIKELGLPFTDQQIQDVLSKHNYNQEAATNYLLNA